MNARSGTPATDASNWKTARIRGIPQTPDSVVTTVKWDAKVNAHPQFGDRRRASRVAERSFLIVGEVAAGGAGLMKCRPKQKLIRPIAAIIRNDVRQP